MEYTRKFTDAEVKCLEHDLMDIKDWIDKAIDGKIAKCKERYEFAQSKEKENYKNRVERETLDQISISQ